MIYLLHTAKTFPIYVLIFNSLRSPSHYNVNCQHKCVSDCLCFLPSSKTSLKSVPSSNTMHRSCDDFSFLIFRSDIISIFYKSCIKVFYVSTPPPCLYLSFLKTKKLFTWIYSSPILASNLSHLGLIYKIFLFLLTVLYSLI